MPSIIIVDDHPANALMIRDLLEQAGYSDIKTFSDPEEAVKHIKEQEYPPIIITDYNMPGLTGSHSSFTSRKRTLTRKV